MQVDHHCYLQWILRTKVLKVPTAQAGLLWAPIRPFEVRESLCVMDKSGKYGAIVCLSSNPGRTLLSSAFFQQKVCFVLTPQFCPLTKRNSVGFPFQRPFFLNCRRAFYTKRQKVSFLCLLCRLTSLCKVQYFDTPNNLIKLRVYQCHTVQMVQFGQLSNLQPT